MRVDPSFEEFVCGDGGLTIDYTWRPRTPANLATLDLTPPEGFRQTTWPPAAAARPAPSRGR